jgi:succinoglycan biosynthesis transport protein ExoP
MQPHGLAPMLNAVLDAFVTKLRRELEQQNERRLAYLREERDQIVGASKPNASASWPSRPACRTRRSCTRATPCTCPSWSRSSACTGRPRRCVPARGRLPARAWPIGTTLQQLSLQAYADERVADNFGINRIEQWTYEQLQSLRSTIDGLTTNNEDRTYVEMRMEAMNEYLAPTRSEVNDTTIRILKDKRSLRFVDRPHLCQ